jgi:hypothetical protein
MESDIPTVRHNELVDMLWKRHTARRLDPAKYFPVGIVNLIFSLMAYHVEELDSEDPLGKWRVVTPSSDPRGSRDET